MRLQRFLSQAGVASRRQAEELIRTGAVTVNGEVVSELGVEVGEKDRVEVTGRRVAPEKPIYRLLLKPRACLSNFEEKGDRATLRRFFPVQEAGLTVVGPLDFPSEGVVLLTTDGALADVMSRRRQSVPMTYHLKLQGSLREAELDRLSRGWYDEDRPIRPISVAALATTGKNTWVEVVVAETRPRAIKAVGEYLRHSVLKISRIRFGSLSFEGLAMGGWRELTKAESSALRAQAGLDAEDSLRTPAEDEAVAAAGGHERKVARSPGRKLRAGERTDREESFTPRHPVRAGKPRAPGRPERGARVAGRAKGRPEREPGRPEREQSRLEGRPGRPDRAQGRPEGRPVRPARAQSRPERGPEPVEGRRERRPSRPEGAQSRPERGPGRPSYSPERSSRAADHGGSERPERGVSRASDRGGARAPARGPRPSYERGGEPSRSGRPSPGGPSTQRNARGFGSSSRGPRPGPGSSSTERPRAGGRPSTPAREGRSPNPRPTGRPAAGPQRDGARPGAAGGAGGRPARPGVGKRPGGRPARPGVGKRPGGRPPRR